MAWPIYNRDHHTHTKKVAVAVDIRHNWERRSHKEAQVEVEGQGWAADNYHNWEYCSRMAMEVEEQGYKQVAATLQEAGEHNPPARIAAVQRKQDPG